LAIRIITDSTSDIPFEERASLGIDIVPLSVIFDGVKYSDGVELKKERFYEMLEKSETLPTTSQVNPDGFHDLFKGYIDAGDDVIGIFISSKLSGTCQSAVIVKEMLGSDRVFIVDSKSATFGAALLVYEAIKLRDTLTPAQEIYRKLMFLRDRVNFFAVVNTLRYLKMGGRLSSTEAVLGGMLHVKPLISIINGEVKSTGKERGQAAAFANIAKKIIEETPDKNHTIIFGHSNAPEIMKHFISYINEKTGVKPDHTCEIGCVIGTHSGPGCVGLAYITEEE
jgi:DegV family protein with EDD domain